MQSCRQGRESCSTNSLHPLASPMEILHLSFPSKFAYNRFYKYIFFFYLRIASRPTQSLKSPTLVFAHQVEMGAQIPALEQLVQSHRTHLRVNPKFPQRQNPTRFSERGRDLPETLIWVDLDCLDLFLLERGGTWSKHPSIGRDIRDKPKQGNSIHST